MALLDLLGRRWALRVIWELRGKQLSSRDLRVACDDVSPSVLQARVDELREAGIVALEAGAGYTLTPEGRRLAGTIYELNNWAKDWDKRGRTGEAD